MSFLACLPLAGIGIGATTNAPLLCWLWRASRSIRDFEAVLGLAAMSKISLDAGERRFIDQSAELRAPRSISAKT